MVARDAEEVGLRHFADAEPAAESSPSADAAQAAEAQAANAKAAQSNERETVTSKADAVAVAKPPSTADSEPSIDRDALVAELARLLVEEKRKHRIDDQPAEAQYAEAQYPAGARNVAHADPRATSGYSPAWPSESLETGAAHPLGHSYNALRGSESAPYEVQPAYARHPAATDWNHPRLTAMQPSLAMPLTYPTTETPAEVRPTSHGDPLSVPAQDSADRATPASAEPHGDLNSTAASAELSTKEFQAALDEVVGLLEAKLKDSTLGEEERARGEVAVRLLRLASERPGDWTKASAAISQLEKSEQEFWTHLMFGLHVFLDAGSTPRMKQRAKLALIELRDAEGRLANLGELEVRHLAFCTEVRSYGVYTEFSENRFQPGQEVILYAEVDNFAAEEKKGGFETSMEGTCEVYSAAGQQVHVHKFDPDTELCRNRRRDFFLPYHYWLPDDLPPGEYSLKLTIKDRKANKMDQGTIKFTVEGRR